MYRTMGTEQTRTRVKKRVRHGTLRRIWSRQSRLRRAKLSERIVQAQRRTVSSERCWTRREEQLQKETPQRQCVQQDLSTARREKKPEWDGRSRVRRIGTCNNAFPDRVFSGATVPKEQQRTLLDTSRGIPTAGSAATTTCAARSEHSAPARRNPNEAGGSRLRIESRTNSLTAFCGATTLTSASRVAGVKNC